ncbi:MAG: ribosome biogenesis GTPase Der [Lactobacillales bacterium]|nr:ribosome biogenesis GTPase Der [Lactobacillales bacterium]
MKKPVVALVGRPNVGKSTIFNRIIGKKISIIEDTPGVTRDRIYGNVNYKNYKFHLVDTGGIDLEDAKFNEEIKVQATLAIEEADVIVFIVDGKEGITSNDLVVKEMLLKQNKKVIVAINKVDSKESKEHLYDFYELGFDNYINVSGEQNIGIEDLLDLVCSDFNEIEEDEYDPDVVKFSIIGRPNVGKSSLVNAILNEDRVIVSDVAGTTRDSVDLPFKYHDKDYVVIDTAGMRKRGKIYENIEKYSLLRSMKAIDRSDVCVIVINAEEGIIEHDKHIAGYAVEAGKAVVIVVNKWDTIEDKDASMKKWKELIKLEFAFLDYAPIVFLSAKTHKRIHTLMPEVLKAYENSRKEIKTSLLNDVIEEAYQLNLPPSYKGKRLKIYFVSQASTQPPKFNIQVNNKGLVHFSYKRYLENKLREAFDFEGTPIILQFKNKGEQEL